MEEDCNGSQEPQLTVALERERIVTLVIINFVEFVDGILFALSNIF
jgi:hypothetical protein